MVIEGGGGSENQATPVAGSSATGHSNSLSVSAPHN